MSANGTAEVSESAIAKVTESEQLKLAKAAIHHVLNAIADDPRKYWLMGYGTGSWEKLTVAAAAIWNQPVDKIRADFRPNKVEYTRYCAEVEDNERLLSYCRENNVRELIGGVK